MVTVTTYIFACTCLMLYNLVVIKTRFDTCADIHKHIFKKTLKIPLHMSSVEVDKFTCMCHPTKTTSFNLSVLT